MYRKVNMLCALALVCFLILGCIGQEEEKVKPTVVSTTIPEPEVTRVAIVFAIGGSGDKSLSYTYHEIAKGAKVSAIVYAPQ